MTVGSTPGFPPRCSVAPSLRTQSGDGRRPHRDGDILRVAELAPHDSSFQFGSLNHRGLGRCNASGQAPLGRLGVEADISQPTIPGENLENDPLQSYRTISALCVTERGQSYAPCRINSLKRSGASSIIICPTSGSSNVAQDLSLLQSATALSKAGCGNLGRRMYVFFATF